MLKFNSKNTRMRALKPFSSASIVEYEQVNAYWANTKI